MSERDMRARVVRALRPLNAIAVENRVCPGTPDVNYVEGWIELKWLREWPARPETPIVVEHYTEQQRIWHAKRRRAGGSSWLLLQVRAEWLLFDGAVAAYTLNAGATRDDLYQAAFAVWPRGLAERELIKCVSTRQSAYYSTAEGWASLRERLRSASEYRRASTQPGSGS